MTQESFLIESKTPFSESVIWQLNRDYYQNSGISAWSDNVVPHHMTSNSAVGKTYAELIFAFLKDLANKGNTTDIIYLLELGAGHGRLAFHILKHLEQLVASFTSDLPPYCYILSDIVEENLDFFQHHQQLKTYLDRGVLDVAYFDAVKSVELQLRHAKKTIKVNELKQPIIAVANYFFDSIPNDLYFIEDEEISSCSVSVHSKKNPEGMDAQKKLKQLTFKYYNTLLNSAPYDEPALNEILDKYKTLVSSTYLFFPAQSMKCLSNLKQFSRAGLLLLTMDKGFHEIHNLNDKKQPDIVNHGSFSLWVNYHALIAYCDKLGGRALFSKTSNFHLEIGCLFFLPDSESYVQTSAAYDKNINQFGPDDFNSVKQLAYFNIHRLKFHELLALYRLSAYDSTFFITMWPRFKHVSQSITYNDRFRLAQTVDLVWEMYFNIDESFDLAYAFGGMMYDLGYYTKALTYFQHSIDANGQKQDIIYNQALCQYQLKQDKLFYETLSEMKISFPNKELITHLESLDMS